MDLHSLACTVQLKELAMIFYFKLHFFSTFDIFAHSEIPNVCLHIHQSSPAEVTYLVHDIQLFFFGYKLIQRSVSRNKSCKSELLNFSA